MALSYDQACEQAVQLRRQGLTYPKIQEHLQRVGYVSPFSHGPVGHLAVRTMIQKRAGDVKKGDKPTLVQPMVDTPHEVSAPKAELLEAIKTIADMPNVGVDMRLKLVKHLLKTAESF